MVAHQRNPFVGADARRGADRKIDRAQAVGPAIDEVAEKDDRTLLAPPRLARGFIDERGEEVGAAVNVADGENLHRPGWRRTAARILDARGLRTCNGPCDKGLSA